MKEIVDKLKIIILELEKARGPILIFALFLREDPLEKWDIVVSASWLDASDFNAYDTIISRIREVGIDMTVFSRLVILQDNDPVVSFLQDACTITNGHIEKLEGEVFSEKFKFSIKSAWVLRCQRPEEHFPK